MPSSSALPEAIQSLVQVLEIDDEPAPGVALDIDFVLLQLGDAVERRAVADAPNAVMLGDQLRQAADLYGSMAARSRSFRAYAQALAYAGRLVEALEQCIVAVEIAELGQEPVLAARARLASVHPLASLGKFDDALVAGVHARQALIAAGETELAARADLNLGAVHAMLDDPASALVYFDRARPVFMDQPGILAQLDSNRGNALTALDRFEQAGLAFQSAVVAFESSNQQLAAAITEGNLASLAARQGRIQESLVHFERSRLLFDQSDSPAHRARLLAEHAEVLSQLGMAGMAVESLRELLPSLTALGLAAEVAKANATLGRSLSLLGLLDEAQIDLELAASELDQLGQPISRARVDLLLANLAIEQGDIDHAAEFAQSATSVLVQSRADHAMAMGIVARIALIRNDLIAATRAIQSGLENALALGLTPLLAELYFLDGSAKRARGERALESFQLAVDASERIRGTLQTERLRSASNNLRSAPYVDLLLESIELRDPDGVEAGLRTSELIKSRGLLDNVHELLGLDLSTHDEPAQAPLRARLSRAQAELNWRYSSVFDDFRPHNSGIDGSILALEREIGELETRLASGRDARFANAAVDDCSSIAAALATGEVAVSYVFVHQELLAFVLNQGKLEVVRNLATVEEIEGIIRRLSLQLGRALSTSGAVGSDQRQISAVRRELNSLWQLLILPLKDYIGCCRRLIASPHGVLHTIPFSALWSGNHYLVEDLEIVQTPNLSLFAHLRRSPKQSSLRQSLLVGVADEMTPLIPDEIETIANVMSESVRVEGSSATVCKVRAIAQQSDVIHFACHGRYARDHPGASGLKLADRWMTLQEIVQMRLPGSHVTLSACDTGRASVQAGDELVGLTRALYAAGARSLIVSLWPVNDSQTVELMTDLYTERARGASFLGALRSSQIRAIKQDVHPALWAPFVFGGFPT